jgi:superfamily II DNA or RNA helicase
LAHTIELVKQARKQFLNLWTGKSVGLSVDGIKENKADIVCGSIQSVALDLVRFKPNDFAYIIIDECHHSTADTYRRILGYFRPQFTLGLTATPERSDGEDLLEPFRNVAHKLDLETAI